MAKIFLLDKSQYLNQMVTVYRGDQWVLKGKVVDRVGGVDEEVDLSGVGASAVFPGASGDTVIVAATTPNAQAGELQVIVPSDQTALTGLSPNGVPVWVQLEGLALNTITTPDEPLAILDPNVFST